MGLGDRKEGGGAPMTKFTHDELKALTPLAYALAWNAGKPECMLSEDSADYEGYATAYDYEKSMASQVLSDVYKEVHNFRPRGVYPIEQMTLADIEGEIEQLYANERAHQAEKALRKAEDAAKIAAAMEGAPLTFNPFAALKGVL